MEIADETKLESIVDSFTKKREGIGCVFCAGNAHDVLGITTNLISIICNSCGFVSNFDIKLLTKEKEANQ